MVYRVETPAGRYAMKRWPVTMERDRLSKIHRFQDYLAVSEKPVTAGLIRWSNGDTLLEADGVYWEITEWKTGLPIAEIGQASDEQIKQCAEAIALLHGRSGSYETQTCKPPGLQQRYEGMLKAARPPNNKRLRFLDSIATHNKYLAANVLHDIHRRAMSIIPDFLDPMKRLAETPVTCFWILRDVWREHILFRDNRLSGIIDFGAARVDWPGLDLVRAFGTLMFDSDPRWSPAVARYSDLRSDNSLVHTDLKIVHRASVALSALQWLDWFAEGHFDWTNRQSQMWNRILEIQRQLEDFQANQIA